MSYGDKIKCPHCKRDIELEVDIEGYGDDAYANINAIPNQNRKGVIQNEVNMERVNKLYGGIHTGKALHGY